jgi:hypothetical protein
MRSAVLAVVLGAHTFAAQDALDDRRISGRVVDEAGRGVAGATVTVWRLAGTISEPARDIEATTRTASDGTFAFDGLFPTHWLVDAETRTHTSMVRRRSNQHPARQASANVSFSGVTHASNVIVTIYPVGAITGRVTRPDGMPIANATVDAEGPLQGSVFGDPPIKTNAKGEYRIDRLPVGSYIVRAHHFARTDFEARGQRVPVDYREYVETFYPGTDQRRRATRVDVHAGADTPNVTIALALEPLFTIVGRIGRLGGRLPRAIWLEWGTRDGMILGDQVVETSNGNFAIREVIGQVGILARAMIGNEILNATATVTVTSGTVRGVYLSLAPAARVFGRLVIEGSRVLPQGVYLQVALQPFWPRVPSFLEEPRITLPVEPNPNAFPEPYWEPVLPDGTFEFTDVIGERTFDVLNLPLGWTVKEIRDRGRVVPNGRMTFRPREIVRDVEIHIDVSP